MVQWFWRRRFLNFVNLFSLFPNYLLLEKGGALHLNKLESPLPKDALCQVWLKLAQWFWRRRWKCEKFTDRQTDRQTTDNRWSEKLTWAFSSGELKISHCIIFQKISISYTVHSTNLVLNSLWKTWWLVNKTESKQHVKLYV